MGIHIVWDCEHAKTPDGYYQVRGGIDYAIAKSLAVAPFADILWMETKTADLHEREDLRRRDPRRVPRQDAGLQPVAVVQLGHDRHERRRDAALPRGARQAGLRLQLHHLRRPSDRRPRRRGVRARRCGRTACSRSRGCSGSSGCSSRPTARRRRSSAGRAPTRRSWRSPAAPRRPRRWARARRSTSTSSRPRCRRSCSRSGSTSGASTTASRDELKVELRPHTRGLGAARARASSATGGEKVANVIFAPIQDRRGRNILSVRDQNTFDAALRQKRLMTLTHLFLIHRYKVDSVHYVTPTEDNQHQTEKMKAHGHLQRGQQRGRPDHRRRRQQGAREAAPRPGPRRAGDADPRGVSRQELTARTACSLRRR